MAIVAPLFMWNDIVKAIHYIKKRMATKKVVKVSHKLSRLDFHIRVVYIHLFRRTNKHEDLKIKVDFTPNSIPLPRKLCLPECLLVQLFIHLVPCRAWRITSVVPILRIPEHGKWTFVRALRICINTRLLPPTCMLPSPTTLTFILVHIYLSTLTRAFWFLAVDERIHRNGLHYMIFNKPPFIVVCTRPIFIWLNDIQLRTTIETGSSSEL